MKKIILTLLFSYLIGYINAQETITISGRVTDFDGNPIDSSIVKLNYPDFSTAYETYTDKDGYYTLKGVKKGKYTSLFAMRFKEYPRSNGVPEKDMRLEFWGWNIIADRDLTINPRYHKLETYGTTVFQEFGGSSGLFVYFRPMSVTKYISYSKEVYLNKAEAERQVDISIAPENLDVKVFADEEPLKINSIKRVDVFMGKGISEIAGYVLQVDNPTKKTDKPYIIFRVEAENKEYNEKGESIYFYEIPQFNERTNN
ncbi:carboxypeptidase-like regulatory domain-containing protein [Prevotella sp. 10(H)]|uniref:carboxypeptidase-like regulatory domain-containing protein n=1 Tax=Prevotella sp. 10(H) TaxID=1158294 RepID=UPI0004A76BE8|nr:carboxypeptidase-like regulatory domain-containing protein [Prevotella sp. 10(H)]